MRWPHCLLLHPYRYLHLHRNRKSSRIIGWLGNLFFHWINGPDYAVRRRCFSIGNAARDAAMLVFIVSGILYPP